jgi:ankyrin repeat protein
MSKLPTLIKLLRKGEHEELNELLHSENVNVNELDPKSGKALLHLAIESSDEDAVNILTKYPGVDLELPSRDGELPLEMAVRLNDAGLVARLLELKADPRRRNSYGETVLCAALSQQTSKDILKRLFQHIDPN